MSEPVKVKAVVMPGAVICGSCGSIMQIEMPRPPSFICPIVCRNLKCEVGNKPALFPLMGIELPAIEDTGPRIIVPGG